MNIIIKADLTDEEIIILSDAKGYQSQIADRPATMGEITMIENPQTRADFIADQYRGLVNADATREFSKFYNSEREEAKMQEEEAIRSKIDSAITVTTE